MRDTILTIRFKPHEMEKLKALAAMHGRKPSTFVRDMIGKARRPTQRERAHEDKQKFEEFAPSGAD